jgi:hypothetical protein
MLGCSQVERPAEEFNPTKISCHGRLNLSLGTGDSIVKLFLNIPTRISESKTVSLTGNLTNGPNVQKYLMYQGGAAMPPWPKDQDHLYRQVKLRSGFAVCRPTGKVDKSTLNEMVELEISFKELVFEDRVIRINQPIVAWWNMAPPP